MNIHFVRRLVVDRDTDGADVGRGVANRQFRCRGKLGKFDSVTGLAQCDRGFSRSAAISYLRRAADARGFLRLEGAGFGCDHGNGSEKQNAGRDSHETYVVGQFGMHETMLPTWWQHVYNRLHRLICNVSVSRIEFLKAAAPQPTVAAESPSKLT